MRDECTDFGRTVSVERVRYFATTDRTLGVGHDGDSWFVFDRAPREPWHKHCGPYSSEEQARAWIADIREGRAR